MAYDMGNPGPVSKDLLHTVLLHFTEILLLQKKHLKPTIFGILQSYISAAKVACRIFYNCFTSK